MDNQPPRENSSTCYRSADTRHPKSSADIAVMPLEDVQNLITRLQSHQINLEVQVEELRERNRVLEQQVACAKELQENLLGSATEDRRRMSHELHDGVGQELTALSLYAGTLVRALKRMADGNLLAGKASEPVRLVDLASKLARGVVECNQHVHRLCHGIMEDPIDAEEMISMLEMLAADASDHVPCRFQCESEIEIADSEVAQQLFRIAQEAVTNALKHSQADALTITLRTDDGILTLEVVDNGIGVDLATREKNGMGIGIMQFRAGLIGAKLQITRLAEGGTQVVCNCVAVGKPNGD